MARRKNAQSQQKGEQNASEWRKPTTFIAIGGLVLASFGGYATWKGLQHSADLKVSWARVTSPTDMNENGVFAEPGSKPSQVVVDLELRNRGDQEEQINSVDLEVDQTVPLKSCGVGGVVDSLAHYTFVLTKQTAPPAYTLKANVFQPFTVPGGQTGRFTATIKTRDLNHYDPAAFAFTLVIRESGSKVLRYGPVGVPANDAVTESLHFENARWSVVDYNGGRPCVKSNVAQLEKIAAMPHLKVPDGDTFSLLLNKLQGYLDGKIPALPHHSTGVG